MATPSRPLLDELVRNSALLANETEFRPLCTRLVDQSLDVSASDLAALYLVQPEDDKLRLVYRRGLTDAPPRIDSRLEWYQFLLDCGETILLNRPCDCLFNGIFLHPDMRSAIALPLLSAKQDQLGVLVLNSLNPDFYNRERFYYLDSLGRLAAGMMQNARLFQEMKDYLSQIEELERYQANVFASMTNLLITTNPDGSIHYFNEPAAERFGLDDGCLGKNLYEIFGKSLSPKVHRAIQNVADNRRTIMGLEGIWQGPDGEMDFSLNVSSLQTKRGRFEGLTLLFTDQSKEEELKQQMNLAVEERRLIKDMFSRYLSQEVVQSMMDSPNSLQLGGAKKQATVFFADIRGYTSFSEGKEPEFIINVLNDYFGEAVEIVIRHRGYIDKFIGDCIMAAWGVPMTSEAEDAFHAVSCAWELQQLVANPKRRFFTGQASHLRIGIGMHTGHLVAGNLGSARRMDYSVIGDTVNIAARLEGVAAADEIIITESTKNLLDGSFRLEQRDPVRVKGKAQPIPIYKVLGKR